MVVTFFSVSLLIVQILIKDQLQIQIIKIESHEMDHFGLNELMDIAEAYIVPVIDTIHRRLMERDFALEDPEVVVLLVALMKILGHEKRRDRTTEIFLMADCVQQGVLDRQT